MKGNVFAIYIKTYSYYLAVYISSYNNNYCNRVPDFIFKKEFETVNPKLKNILGD